MTRELLKQALDALEGVAQEEPINQDEMGGCVWCGGPGGYVAATGDPKDHDATCAWVIARKQIASIRAHLAKPERPVNCGSGHCSCIECIVEPAWHDAPNAHGVWICNEGVEVPYDWRAFDINKQILDLTPPKGERWFGPIPKDES